ncbi:unnamed protein product [Clonostachys rhizophaga]|uniref:Uncharacterized protein n=1 Tax=Clonostachys rhizophaga TaxID=160324 RepID=A0A9N9YV82_9HYPO|nr:unnamed protein product [Clonostachys rhizophaga]
MSSQAADAFSERFRNHKPISKPVPAYLPQVGSPLAVDKDHYAAVQQAFRVLVKEFTLSIRSGRVAGGARRLHREDRHPSGTAGWFVALKFRDLNIWDRHNPRERFLANRTPRTPRTPRTYGRL